MEDFENLLADVQSFRSNRLKDNQDRRGNLDLLEQYYAKLELFTKRLDNLRKSVIDKDFNINNVNEAKIHLTAIEGILEDIKDILDSRKIKIPTMTETFSLKTAGGLLPQMDGTENSVKMLVDSIRLYSEFLKAEDHKHLINFVLKTRLTESAKVRLDRTYASVELLINAIRTNFITQKSATVLANQIQNARQLEKTLDQYSQEIEQLLSDLTLAQSEGDENLLKSLRKVNEKIAVNSFANGIRNHDVRLIVKARNCATLREAITVAKDEEISKASSSNVFHFQNNRGHHNSRSRYPRSGYKNFNRTQSQFRGNNSNFNLNHQRGSQHQRPFSQTRGINRGNVRSFGYFNRLRARGNFSNRSNAYVAVSDSNDGRNTTPIADVPEEGRFFRD